MKLNLTVIHLKSNILTPKANIYNKTIFVVVQGDKGPAGFAGEPGVKGEKVCRPKYIYIIQGIGRMQKPITATCLFCNIVLERLSSFDK